MVPILARSRNEWPHAGPSACWSSHPCPRSPNLLPGAPPPSPSSRASTSFNYRKGPWRGTGTSWSKGIESRGFFPPMIARSRPEQGSWTGRASAFCCRASRTHTYTSLSSPTAGSGSSSRTASRRCSTSAVDRNTSSYGTGFVPAPCTVPTSTRRGPTRTSPASGHPTRPGPPPSVSGPRATTS